MKQPMLAVLCAAALSAAAQGQSVVSPVHFTKAEGNTYGYGGLGVTQTPSVLLAVHDELAGTARTIRAYSVRRDGNTDTTSHPASSWLVTVFASTAATTAAAPSATLASNHGADKRTVTSFGLVNLPASKFAGPNAPFEFRVPFSAPFPFAGAGPLCVETQVQSRTHTHYYYFDFVSGTGTNPYPEYLRWGSGCKATGITSPMSLSPSASANWPGAAVTFNYSGSSMPANGLVSLGFGVSNRSAAGLPLPFELPGSAAAPSGACRLYNDIVLSIPALTTASGTMSLSIGVMATPALNGANLFAQAFAIDAAANALGVVASNGVQHHVVAPYTKVPVGTVYADASLGPTGTVLANQGYVTKFDT